jgi:hypothetical protein
MRVRILIGRIFRKSFEKYLGIWGNLCHRGNTKIYKIMANSEGKWQMPNKTSFHFNEHSFIIPASDEIQKYMPTSFNNDLKEIGILSECLLRYLAHSSMRL